MFRRGSEARSKYFSAWPLGGLLLLGGGLEPRFRVYFPLFSASFAREFPSGWKTTESSGNKIVVNCSQSTYKISSCVFEWILFELNGAVSKHTGSRLNRKEIAKFRIHPSAKVLDERYFVSAWQARSGENNDPSTGFVFFHQAMSQHDIIQMKGLCYLNTKPACLDLPGQLVERRPHKVLRVAGVHRQANCRGNGLHGRELIE